jgi:glutathione S-transferase
VVELYQFTVSHFNEKARWALDYKGVEHVRHSLLPGPHKVTIYRLTGQQQVPVLRDGDALVAGSAAILEYLEARHPESALYPSDPSARARAIEVQRYFDDEVGPGIRLAMFHDLLVDPSYFVRLFTWDQPAVKRIAYRGLFPIVRLVMTREMGIDAANAARGRDVTGKALDFVARETGRTGYLVGDSFSVADLTAASLLAPAVEIEPTPFGYPEPYPRALRDWWARWREHPAAPWVRRMFGRHRRNP